MRFIRTPTERDVDNLSYNTTRDRLWQSGKLEYVDHESRVKEIHHVDLVNTKTGNLEKLNAKSEQE